MSPQPSALDFSPKPLSSAKDASRTAREFSALFRHVINTTISHDHVDFMPVRQKGSWRGFTWMLTAQQSLRPVPIRLTNGTWLLAQQVLCVRKSDADGEHWLTTLLSRYQWQADPEGRDWWVRWDYRREEAEDGSPIPRERRAHIHLNGTPPGFGTELGRPFHKLHLPCRRVGIEDIAHYLIGEGGCTAISQNAEDVISEARVIFDRIQRRLPVSK